jgi:hypothetical protein
MTDETMCLETSPPALFSKYSYSYQVKEDEIVRASGKDGVEEEHKRCGRKENSREIRK